MSESTAMRPMGRHRQRFEPRIFEPPPQPEELEQDIQPPRIPDPRHAIETEEFDVQRKHHIRQGGENILSLIIPISLCMALAVAGVRTVTYEDRGQTPEDFLFTTGFSGGGGATGSGDTFGSALINALIILGAIVVMTIVMVLLYKFRFYKTLHTWLMMSTVVIIGLFGLIYLNEVFIRYNAAMDYITTAIILWNFCVVGVVAIHWKAPLRVQQFFLILLSALMAIVLVNKLPGWTTWVLLGLIAIYDLFAVLCPNGPLRILVETAAERDEGFMPALVYSSTVMYFMATPPASSSSSSNQQNQGASGSILNGVNKNNYDRKRSRRSIDKDRFIPRNQHTTRRLHMADVTSSTALVNSDSNNSITVSDPNDPSGRGAQRRGSADDGDSGYKHNPNEGIKLGLGDFIFYSLLVGKAATESSWTTIITTFTAVLMGMVLTLLLLTIVQKALPALPISVAFGLVFYFASTWSLNPYIEFLGVKQVFL
eukprot:Nk52_evm110s226 gene=Nk52_evmTU110s226